MDYVITVDIKGTKAYDLFKPALEDFIKRFNIFTLHCSKKSKVEINSTYTAKEFNDSLGGLL